MKINSKVKASERTGDGMTQLKWAWLHSMKFIHTCSLTIFFLISCTHLAWIPLSVEDLHRGWAVFFCSSYIKRNIYPSSSMRFNLNNKIIFFAFFYIDNVVSIMSFQMKQMTFLRHFPYVSINKLIKLIPQKEITVKPLTFRLHVHEHTTFGFLGGKRERPTLSLCVWVKLAVNALKGRMERTKESWILDSV